MKQEHAEVDASTVERTPADPTPPKSGSEGAESGAQAEADDLRNNAQAEAGVAIVKRGTDEGRDDWWQTQVWGPVKTHAPFAVTAFIGGLIALVISLIAGTVWFVTAVAPGPTFLGAKWTALATFLFAVIALLAFMYKAAQAVASAGAEKAVARRNSAELDDDVVHRINANRDALLVWEHMVQRQARGAYMYSMLATGMGLLVLVGGGILIISTDDLASQVAVAGLSGIAGAIGGYIGRTFLEIHKLAQQQLNFYFVEPLVANYLLAAERLIQDADKHEPSERKHDPLYQDLVKTTLDTARSSLVVAQPNGRNGLANSTTAVQ
jgi:uncharacterized protein GlcG (DUF336 family)